MSNDRMNFRHWHGIPLFAALQQMNPPRNGSKIDLLMKEGTRFYVCKKKDIAIAVIHRLLRDKPMLMIDYKEMAYKVANRYLSQWHWLEKEGYLPIGDVIGMAYIENGVLHYPGRFHWEMTYEKWERIRTAAKHRDDSLQQNKYQNMTGEEREFRILLLETEGYLYDQTWLRRKKNRSRARKRATIDKAVIDIDGGGNQQRSGA